MLTDEQKMEIRRLWAEGLSYDHIGKQVGCSQQTVRNIAADVVSQDNSRDKDADDAEVRKVFRRIKRTVRRYQAAVQAGKIKPCEHCQWRMNKDPRPVCVVCYREIL